MSSEYLVPYWRDDPDYYPIRHPERVAHMAEIKRRRRIDGMLDAAVGDRSYAVVVPRCILANA